MGLAKNYRTGGKLGKGTKRKLQLAQDAKRVAASPDPTDRPLHARNASKPKRDGRAIPIGGIQKRTTGMGPLPAGGTGTFKGGGLSSGTLTPAGQTPPSHGLTATPDYTGGTVPSQGQAQPEPATPDITGSFDHSLRATTSASMGGNPGFSSSARSGGLSKMLKRKPSKIKIRRAASGHRFY